MNKLGTHLIVEYYGCDKQILDDTDSIRQHMLIAAEKTGATIVGEVFHHFNPYGVSGAVIAPFHTYLARTQLCSSRFFYLRHQMSAT